MTSILLVEDHELNRDMLSRRLKRKGYQILEALSAEQALQLAEEQRPQIILMDMGLPEMDGWEATRILKARAETAQIPIIGLSAHAMSGDRQRGIKAGCDEYDTKPVDFERLLTKIQSVLDSNLAEDRNLIPK